MIFSYCPTPGHEKPPKVGFWESAVSTTIFVMRASAAGAASIALAASASPMFRRHAGFIFFPPLSNLLAAIAAGDADISGLVMYGDIRVGVAGGRIGEAIGVERIQGLFLELGNQVHAHRFLGLQVAAAMPARRYFRVARTIIE